MKRAEASTAKIAAQLQESISDPSTDEEVFAGRRSAQEASRSRAPSHVTEVQSPPVELELRPAPALNASELIPLRQRANSDLFDRESARTMSQGDVVKETSERWRNRLWPGRAIIAYCRILTRCRPPVINERILQNLMNTCPVPHWNATELVKVGTVFSSVKEHSGTFFLLTVEESREAVTKGEIHDNVPGHEGEREDGDEMLCADIAKAPDEAKPRLMDCEVLCVVAELEFGALPQAFDVRLGSVWVVRVFISHGKKACNQQAPSTVVSGGDLMILTSASWPRPLLGIIQPWDPDYDLKFGGSFSSNVDQTNSVNTGMANLLVCVDRSEEGNDDVGGWARPGMIYGGACFSMIFLGNVMTYLRECQALMSLSLLNPVLRETILNPTSMARRIEATLASQQGVRTCPNSIPVRLWEALAERYNPSQLQAIRSACLRDEDDKPLQPVLLLQGPPGTGKTKTILGVLAAFLAGALKSATKVTKVVAGASFQAAIKTEDNRPRSDSVGGDSTRPADRPRIMVCAPSNTAIDELVYRILSQGILGADGERIDDLNVVRIGNTNRDDYRKRNQHRIWQQRGGRISDADYQTIRVVERVALENIVEDRRRMLQASDVRKAQNVSFKASDIRKQILERADIVACTLSGAGSQPILEVVLRIPGFKFDAVIIDEAAQAVEPSSLIPFKFNPQVVVLVGDPCQLPASLFSRAAKEANYGQSLFLRLQRTGVPVSLLETQYRMHYSIAAFPSKRYYQDKLITDEAVMRSGSHNLPYHQHPSGLFQPMVLHDVVYGREELEGSSYINRAEATYVVQLFQAMLERYPEQANNVGIIAPYRAQRRLIISLFKKILGHQACSRLDTEIATVDGFQGREKDIIIFSCVRAPPRHAPGSSLSGGGIGFLKEWQRLNVAITRAKYAVWVVGHAVTLYRDAEWASLVAYFQQLGAHISISNEQSLRQLLHRNLSEEVNRGGKQERKRRRLVAEESGEAKRVVSSHNRPPFHHFKRQLKKGAEKGPTPS